MCQESLKFLRCVGADCGGDPQPKKRLAPTALSSCRRCVAMYFACTVAWIGSNAAMHIDVVPNRNSRPVYRLREPYRDGNRVNKRTLAKLSSRSRMSRAPGSAPCSETRPWFRPRPCSKPSARASGRWCWRWSPRGSWPHIPGSPPRAGRTPPPWRRTSVWPMPRRLSCSPAWTGCASARARPSKSSPRAICRGAHLRAHHRRHRAAATGVGARPPDRPVARAARGVSRYLAEMTYKFLPPLQALQSRISMVSPDNPFMQCKDREIQGYHRHFIARMQGQRPMSSPCHADVVSSVGRYVTDDENRPCENIPLTRPDSRRKSRGAGGAAVRAFAAFCVGLWSQPPCVA